MYACLQINKITIVNNSFAYVDLEDMGDSGELAAMGTGSGGRGPGGFGSRTWMRVGNPDMFEMKVS